MTIDQLIESLIALKSVHGGHVDVTVWQYGGGMDDLCNVKPEFDKELGMVVLETAQHESGLRR